GQLLSRGPWPVTGCCHSGIHIPLPEDRPLRAEGSVPGDYRQNTPWLSLKRGCSNLHPSSNRKPWKPGRLPSVSCRIVERNLPRAAPVPEYGHLPWLFPEVLPPHSLPWRRNWSWNQG